MNPTQEKLILAIMNEFPEQEFACVSICNLMREKMIQWAIRKDYNQLMASISSQLSKMIKKNLIVRSHNKTTRGGNLYKLPINEQNNS